MMTDLFSLKDRVALVTGGSRGIGKMIAAGFIAPDMNIVARDHEDEVVKRVPARRVGRDEDMAGAAIYLASRAGDYVVGSTLIVDGGVTYAR